jgi:hypothetical protein
MSVCYVRNDSEVDAERCRISLRDKSPIALSTIGGAGCVTYMTGFVQSIEFDPNRAVGMRWLVELEVLTVALLSSAPPQVLESVRRQCRVDGGAGDRATLGPSLDRPGVVSLVREGIAAGVPQHVGMDLELQAAGGRGTLDHLGEAGRGKGRAALADEDKG